MLAASEDPVNERGTAGVLNWTVRGLRSAWNEIAGSVREAEIGSLPPELPDRDRERVVGHMRACLEGRGGEVSARARAAALGRAYLSLGPVGRERFLRALATEFDAPDAKVDQAITDLRGAADAKARAAARRALRRALEPQRRRLLMQFNALPEGIKFLVDLRAELLPLARRDPVLAELESDLRDLLAAWFDVGFLELRRISWNSPASLLEKLIAYEAVHEIDGWTDLKNRLDADRRCFAFFHPRMPDEPLIFVEVALTTGIADNIQTLLDPAAPQVDHHAADTAIFYSISNTQRGLDGIGFGGFLIKRVVDELAGELGNLDSYATLSPIPGFRRWLDGWLERDDGKDAPVARRTLRVLGNDNGHERPLKEIAELLGSRERLLAEIETFRRPLTRLCARYLAEEKRDDGRARDPVAHFHLSNGARIERINWLADTSAKGIAQSVGMMVNYQYRPEDIAQNHEAYIGSGEVPASSAVRALLRH
jgi:malonyl-CoA decarboxylase